MVKKDSSRIIDKLKNVSAKYIILTGGEPTLIKDLPEIISNLKEKSNSQIVLNTNGINLNSKLLSQLTKAGLNILKISIHSFDPVIYDRIVGIDGSFEKLLKSMEAIRKFNQNKHQLEVRSNTVIFGWNYKDIDRMIDFASQYNISSMQFSLASKKWQARGKNSFSILSKQQLGELYFEIYLKLLKKAISEKIRVEFRPMFVDLVNLPSNKLVKKLISPRRFDDEINNYTKGFFGRKFYQKYKCRETYSSLIVNLKGDIYFCCGKQRRQDIIGNILIDDLEKIILQKKRIKPKNCEKCHLFFGSNKYV